MVARKAQRPLAVVLLGAALASSLSGCVGLVAAGAVGGTLAASDRRTVGSAGHVNIASFNRRVLLTGEVRDEEMKNAVEREVRAIEGVLSVTNELEIAGPSSYTSRSNDAIITTKVKASLVDAKDISANSVKVVTERGNVYLMGRVTQREGGIASDIARGVPGVYKVVKVFEYISEDEWKQYQSAAN
jgi:osmotically-inducible protein OsmY